MAAGLVAVVPFSSGVFFVRAMRGDADTAILGLALQVANAYLIFTTLGQRIVRPHIAGPFGLDWSFLRKLALFNAGFLGGLLVLAWAGAAVFITFFLTADFRAAIVPMSLLLIGALFTALGRVGSVYLVVLQSERSLMLASGIAAAVYVLGCLFLVPWLSYTGAALMTLLASVLGTGLIYLCVRLRWPKTPPGWRSKREV
jgi:O-antigen/teichoic acid export membrane protein